MTTLTSALLARILAQLADFRDVAQRNEERLLYGQFQSTSAGDQWRARRIALEALIAEVKESK